uniref:SH3 domain-containing protein n=1 Tax=Glossina brevipalpis TaxID=37001 RepID=A0A1A9W8N0_9MUSC
MNRLRSQKFKLSSSFGKDCNFGSNNNNNNPTNGNNSHSLLNKLSKRYSTLSNKIRRRSPKGSASKSPPRPLSGSYDMNGSNSDDHRLEIGAPILISSTTLDTDRFDVSAERLKMIGGGVADTSTLIKLKPLIDSEKLPSSSGSENEVYVDALSSTPLTEELENGGDEIDNENSEKTYATPEKMDSTYEEQTSDSPCSQTNPLFQENNGVLMPTNHNHSLPELKEENFSGSVQNIHRSELKVFLKKANSMNLKEVNEANDEVFNDFDENLPKLPELYGIGSIVTIDNDDHDADKENSSPSMIASAKSKSEPNTPMYPQEKRSGFLNQHTKYQSADNLNHRKNKRRSVMFSSNTSVNQSRNILNGSKNSVLSQISNFDDYDLKSVSCHSLNAQSLFVSIDELNEITQQINETEEFNQAIDLEYCLHRDQLKPSERRITLMKNKNSTLITLNHNKEKLKKSWSDVKHWIGEEGAKLRDAVQRQPLVQRVGSSKLNLSHLETRNSPSFNGSTILRYNNASQERALENCEQQATTESTLKLSSGEAKSTTHSCDNVADKNNDFNNSPTDDSTPPITKQFRYEGQNGFEELRRYIKQGGDFGKELVLILQERIDSELLYSKSLSKMANKLNKACRELPGSVAEAWRGVATEMESRSDIHRQLSVSLNDEIVKPLKAIVESHHKSRKSVESTVDKAARVLAEWRVSEAKAKKASHAAARENEKLQDAMLDVRIQKSPSIALLHQGVNKAAAEKEIKSAEKDCAKLDQKRKKAEETVKRADVEYYTMCVRAERARVDWEMAVLRGSTLLQTIENQRLINMKNFISNYTRLTANVNPVLEGLLQRLEPQAESCNVTKDMQIIKNIRRNAEGPSEQLLPDFYCEHTTLAMNRERRKHALVKLLQLVKTDLERERRSRNGLKNLSQSLTNQENQNITDKLYHIRSMLTYLEGARFKLHSALLELDHKPRSSHPLAQHIQITRDRTGLQQSVLKVPLWLKNNDRINTSTDSTGDDSVDYDCISQANTTISTSNISCMDNSSISVHSDNNALKAYSRSKSNIETFSTQTQICMNGLPEKTKTLKSTNDYTDACSDRGQADGGSNQQDSDFDEFSSQEEDDEQTTTTNCSSGGRREHKAIITKSTTLSNLQSTEANHYYQNTNEMQEKQNNQIPIVLGKCKALYSYTPKLYDELELNPGDIIEVHAKQEDGWWLGALRNQIGIFPATYVEEMV